MLRIRHGYRSSHSSAHIAAFNPNNHYTGGRVLIVLAFHVFRTVDLFDFTMQAAWRSGKDSLLRQLRQPSNAALFGRHQTESSGEHAGLSRFQQTR